MNREDKPQNPHHSAHEASHQAWDYAQGAMIWCSGTPIAVNIAPCATHMSEWLRRVRNDLWQPGGYSSPELECQRNPYSDSLVTLTASIGLVIDDSVKFIESNEPIHPTEAEIRRVRLECELVLYAARFCEAVIKQMLHCTAFPPKLYQSAALGQLLSQDCRTCRKANHPTHSFSLLGSLAHHFFLCQEIDACALDHLILANKRRNLEAAHSNAQVLRLCEPTKSRNALGTTLDEVLGAFSHLLEHVSKIEIALIKEVEIRIRYYPAMPPRSAYDFFLTITVTDYDSGGLYRGLGYGEEHRRKLSNNK
ncbi:hypothetical protein VDG03_20870 [Xanthomonas campestris pv. raphani]|uniref:hypothetical protein n=2 Tax=Xanthomonas campestris TaxID=339 RepID=UPI002B2231DC|nr:hypothetical protein [Xanthomonas campestris]MEA9753412.1 hypothetical protein [Xanthomonas campestris pv. raphani]MEA9813701.1 hypothetical protein [Xanthomonas campestris pv. raphani]